MTKRIDSPQAFCSKKCFEVSNTKKHAKNSKKAKICQSKHIFLVLNQNITTLELGTFVGERLGDNLLNEVKNANRYSTESSRQNQLICLNCFTQNRDFRSQMA